MFQNFIIKLFIKNLILKIKNLYHMGLFTSDTPKIFKNKEEIKKALLEIHSLDYKQRPVVMGAFIGEMDNGGVTRTELIKIIHELKKENVISDTDRDSLHHLASDKKV